MRGFIFVVLLFLLILILALLSSGTIETLSPKDFTDSGITENESYVYDNNSISYGYTNTSGGNTSFHTFFVDSHFNNEDITQVDVLFDIEVTGTSDDQWALQYSEDGGTSWSNLRAMASGDLGRQV